MNIQPNRFRRIVIALPLAAALLIPTASYAANKDMVQLQTQVQELQDAVARLQQSNDERMGVLKDLVQQSSDSVNKMAAAIDTVQKQMQTQQEAQGAKVDQVSGQIQALNDSLDELKTRMGRLEKLTQDIQNQQQSMSANLQPQGITSSPAPQNQPQTQSPPAEPPQALNSPGVDRGPRGKPLAGLPATAPTADSAAPPADELYKTALGDYMSAKYPLASSEFGDVIKSYPENPLAGNAYYYQGEIEYRGGHYANAVKSYDAVLEQYPDNNKVPAAHLHKAEALIALKQTEAGIREYRALIQRFPNSPEATQARSKLSGMAVPVRPRTAR